MRKYIRLFLMGYFAHGAVTYCPTMRDPLTATPLTATLLTATPSGCCLGLRRKWGRPGVAR